MFEVLTRKIDRLLNPTSDEAHQRALRLGLGEVVVGDGCDVITGYPSALPEDFTPEGLRLTAQQAAAARIHRIRHDASRREAGAAE